MKVSEILTQICETRGSIAKSDILKEHAENRILQRALKYGLNSFTPFHIVKVPNVKDLDRRWPLNGVPEEDRWAIFFDVADSTASRKLTGNAAIEAMHSAFCSVSTQEEKWMRKILKKRLAIGASAKTVNKVWPMLIPTFEVSLAQKFDPKRIEGMSKVFVEPKLDGIRCFAIVENNEANLFARSGKLITNFDDTVGSSLVSLGDGCYDGELMGEDFISLMRQAYRKDNVNSDNTYLSLFDYLPIEEWKSGETVMTTSERHDKLMLKIANASVSKFIRTVPRHLVGTNFNVIMNLHDRFVKQGYEGAMIKTVESPYRFGRSYDIMKLKEFHDVDLIIERLDEGTGRHKGRLGSVMVNYLGTEVKVGSGFSDELREQIWSDPTCFVGRMIEVRYQEVTPDGSLRFPTFVCFRNDR